MIDATALFLVRKLGKSGEEPGFDRSETMLLPSSAGPIPDPIAEPIPLPFGVASTNSPRKNSSPRMNSEEGAGSTEIHSPNNTLSSLNRKFKAINRRYSRTIGALADQIYRRADHLGKSFDTFFPLRSSEGVDPNESKWREEVKVLERLLEGERDLFAALENFASEQALRRKLFQILRRSSPSNVVFWDHSTLEFGYEEDFYLPNGQRLHFEGYFARPAVVALQDWMLKHSGTELTHTGETRNQRPLRNLLNYTEISRILPGYSPNIPLSELAELFSRELPRGSRVLIVSCRAPRGGSRAPRGGSRAPRGQNPAPRGVTGAVTLLCNNVYSFNPTISTSEWSDTFEDVLYSLQ